MIDTLRSSLVLQALTLFFSCLLTINQSQAGISITGKEASGATSKVLIDKEMARIELSNQQGYLLLDMAQPAILAVNDDDKQVVNLTSPAPEPSAHAAQAISNLEKPTVSMKRIGPGPVISGYETTRYQVYVNDTLCYEEFLAEEPLHNELIMRFIKTMAKASRQDNNDKLLMAIDKMNLCNAADNLVDDQYPTLGLPMRTVNLDHKVTHEIIKIDTKVDYAHDQFLPPADYIHLSRSQLRDMAYKKMQSMATEDATTVERQQIIDEMVHNHGTPVETKDLSTESPKPGLGE